MDAGLFELVNLLHHITSFLLTRKPQGCAWFFFLPEECVIVQDDAIRLRCDHPVTHRLMALAVKIRFAGLSIHIDVS